MARLMSEGGSHHRWVHPTVKLKLAGGVAHNAVAQIGGCRWWQRGILQMPVLVGACVMYTRVGLWDYIPTQGGAMVHGGIKTRCISAVAAEQ
jgi:hypothetical protein